MLRSDVAGPAAPRHGYFAYGSNLNVQQMALRCPHAANPRPATLADHDWLINERGVATVEPFDGSLVHGVVWQLTDHDLATLDSAEGVPVRSAITGGTPMRSLRPPAMSTGAEAATADMAACVAPTRPRTWSG